MRSSAAAKTRPAGARASEPERLDDEHGFEVTPEKADELRQVIAETDEDLRAGRAFTLDEVLRDLRRRR